MSNPKISVIIPVYNVEKYLNMCLDSIVNQTLKEIEIICLNDCSTDNSLAILKEYAKKDDRIKIIDKENEGIGYTRKVGLDNANGKYILFCDSDDYYAELTAFEELYNYIEKVKVDVVIFGFIKNNEIDNSINYQTDYDKYPQKDIFSYLDMDNIFIFQAMAWSKIYSKKFLDKYDDWYFPKKTRFEDAPFHSQIILRAKCSFLNKYLYIYRIRPNSIMNSGYSDGKIIDSCKTAKEIFNITKNKSNKQQFLSYFFNRLKRRYLFKYQITTIETIKYIIETINLFNISDLSNIKDREEFFFFKAGLRMSPEQYWVYLNKKTLKFKNKEIAKLKETRQNRDNRIKALNAQIKTKNEQLQQKNSEIQNLLTQNKNLQNQNNIQDLTIKHLQNSWSYRIGRRFTYPLSIPFEFYKYIRDYNLVKKSDLFDSEYYLANNEDVKNAKMNPIKHYLKFGWKEGRNPSAEFNGNEYLNKRPDVRVSGICPLVHYIKFRKDGK